VRPADALGNRRAPDEDLQILDSRVAASSGLRIEHASNNVGVVTVSAGLSILDPV
jgi:hypothetical protein